MSPDDAAVPAMGPGPGSGRVGPDEVDRESWREFLAPGPFGNVDPALYRFETTAAPETAVEAWMTAQPLAEPDPTAALVRDRAEARLRVAAPDQMAAYDQLRSESRQAPLDAMRAIAPMIQRGDPGAAAAPPAGGSPTTRATAPVAGGGSQPGPLGPWASLSSETGPAVVAGPDSAPAPPSRQLEL